MTETIVYDLSSTLADKERQSRTISIDSVDEFKFISIESPNANITDFLVTIEEGSRDAEGMRFNSTITIEWLFLVVDDDAELASTVTDNPDAQEEVAYLATQNIVFILKYETTGLLREDNEAQNYFSWRPFLNNFRGPKTFMTNVSTIVNLPWGISEREHADNKELLPLDVGYNITTNLLTTAREWQQDSVKVIYWSDCYHYAFDGDYLISMKFDRQADLCNKFPEWIYVVFGVGNWFLILSVCSLLAFCFFEKPFKNWVAADTPMLAPEDQLDEQGRFIGGNMYAYNGTGSLYQNANGFADPYVEEDEVQWQAQEEDADYDYEAGQEGEGGGEGDGDGGGEGDYDYADAAEEGEEGEGGWADEEQQQQGLHSM
eukprot:TRINITY_DN66555_c7_g1_i2.p1 TRINITY_DN66555_c7_g1~~TRINITY_DN66555_c7_g1_i2.p1  ORF type:complete len:374 (-),score=60.35 TRINITY_DN66555_c7_g1_i2:976-2097(-)